MTSRELPILFSAPMIRAILDGSKTQTRRIVKLPRSMRGGDLAKAYADLLYGVTPGLHVPMPDDGRVERLRNPWGWPEPVRLWVKETFAQVIARPVPSDEAWWPGREAWPGVPSERPSGDCRTNSTSRIIWRADGEMPGDFPEPWRPSIFMWRWASRIDLEVTGVRAERLGDISEEDAIAEGCSGFDPEPAGEGGTIYARKGVSSAPNPRAHYQVLWETIHGDGSWVAHSNSWVWVITFKRVRR